MVKEAGRHHAVVIGGSMAGLLATRVLTDHYDRVTLVERDAFPSIGENRRGVPQGRHTHGLLASGRQVLDRLFPGISEEFISGGAIAGDIVGEVRWFNEGGCHRQFDSGLDGLLMSRPFLEGIVRSRVIQLTKVQLRESAGVEGLVASSGNLRVTGIQIASEVLSADLVVDASGRGSHSPQWLEALGYRKPPEERVEIALGYTTRFFRRRPQDLNGDWGAVIPPTPHGKRGGVILAQEDNRWTVTLVAHFGNYAPTELDGFIEFARNLPAPYVHEVVRDAEPLGDGFSARFPASVRRRYEKMRRFPEGYLVFGDAICSFNPVYGQGMSVAALESEQLAQALAEGSAGLEKRFFARAERVVDIPWSIAVGNDLRMAEAVGPRTAGHDEVPAMAFHRVANLLAAPPSLMHPRVAARVLWGNLRSFPQECTAERSFQTAAGE